jgi:thioredoxin reductase
MNADANRLECIIIGGGPAGLSAGLVLGRCRRRVLLCDDGRYRNRRSAALHCFMGHDGIKPPELLKRSRQELQQYHTVSFTGATVRCITRNEERFTVEFNNSSTVVAPAVLIASGVVDELPPIEGLEELFGRSVHVCPYCDGWEHRDAPVAVYGRGEKGASFARLLRQWTEDLVLCTDGERVPSDLAHILAAQGISLCEQRIERLEGADGCLKSIRLDDGTALSRKALFITTGEHLRSRLLEGLGCAYDDKGGLACDPDGRTSIPGAFAAGDVSRDVQLAIIAAAEGARAALGINKYLIDETRSWNLACPQSEGAQARACDSLAAWPSRDNE